MQEKKVKALKEASIPKTASELKSFLGLASYCSRFIPGLATLNKPLRELTKDRVKWSWNDEHQQAFDKIKTELVTHSISYYNKAWNTELVTDASPVGLAAVMTQFDPDNPTKRHIVQFISRSLSNVEVNYSQAENEALAVTWASERLHLNLYADDFTIVTDNKDVELIYGKSTSKPKA